MLNIHLTNTWWAVTVPGTTDKKTNKTESLPSEEEGAVRRPDMDTETIQSCYCQDAMSTQKKKFQRRFVCLRETWGCWEDLTQVDTNEFKPEKRTKQHWPGSKQRKSILDLRVTEPDISVKPLHFNTEKICKMVSACLIKRQIAAEGQELRPEPRSPYFYPFHPAI